ncbi:hypothetical protein WSM22_04860 [Cytophagales bacterium WSM2-2]|nr:hypothetical protein WSM22_04860 [Cytophagales bacterium WSM2-2]
MSVDGIIKPLICSVAFSLLIHTNTFAQTNQNMLQKFTLRPAAEILRDLYLLKQRERSGEEITQPLITIMPGNKLPVSGFLIDFKDDKDQRGVVLEAEGSNDLVFLELYWITGISIRDADKVAHLLVDLTAADIKSTATRLDIKNKIKKEAERLTTAISPINFTIAEDDYPSTGPQLYLTNLFITDLAMSLIEIAKTDLGKESIKQSIKTIDIKKGKSLDVKLAQGTLTIFYNFERSYTTNSARNILIEKIYNLL